MLRERDAAAARFAPHALQHRLPLPTGISAPAISYDLPVHLTYIPLPNASFHKARASEMSVLPIGYRDSNSSTHHSERSLWYRLSACPTCTLARHSSSHGQDCHLSGKRKPEDAPRHNLTRFAQSFLVLSAFQLPDSCLAKMRQSSKFLKKPGSNSCRLTLLFAFQTSGRPSHRYAGDHRLSTTNTPKQGNVCNFNP